MIYIETLTLINGASYSIRQKIPFSVYGESLIILAQNAVIVLMFWTYSKSISVLEKIALFFGYLAYSYLLFSGDHYLTQTHWDLVQKSSMFLMVASRVPQIITNFMNKSTGQLAFITFFLNFAGGLARLFTVMVETSDFMYQLQYILGTVLSAILVVQFALYWNTGKKVTQKAPESPSKKNRREKVE
jgi:hypothetical protein